MAMTGGTIDSAPSFWQKQQGDPMVEFQEVLESDADFFSGMIEPAIWWLFQLNKWASFGLFDKVRHSLPA